VVREAEVDICCAAEIGGCLLLLTNPFIVFSSEREKKVVVSEVGVLCLG
jgi:hypothetical protein